MICSSVNRVVFISAILQNLRTYCQYLGTAGRGQVRVLGSGVSDKALVDGVTITYKLNEQLLSSTQVGKMCEFQSGTAMMISTTGNETRIQPNNAESCPK
jgi:hypothetical protein